MKQEELTKILGNVYGEDQEYVDHMLKMYQQLYALPVITTSEEIPSRMFQFYKRGERFVVAAICNEAGEILVVQRGSTIWQLIGSFVSNGDSIEDTCDRLATGKANIYIDEVEPIAIVENEFKCENRTILHRGIAFLVLTRSAATISTGQNYTYVTDCPELMAFSNQEIFAAALTKIHSKRQFSPDDEIEIGRGHVLAGRIHKAIVTPIFDYFSSRRLREVIKEHCQGAETILDVACGNDPLIIDLSKTAKLCVANDISWDTLRFLRKRGKSRNVIFTSHNAIDLPFKDRFDAVICKNVLHHVHNLSEFAALTETLMNIGRKLIIVDIENPTKSTLHAKIWNTYYSRFLGDRGRYFMNYDEFQQAMSCIYTDAQIAFSLVSTIKGNYMFAIVVLPESSVDR